MNMEQMPASAMEHNPLAEKFLNEEKNMGKMGEIFAHITKSAMEKAGE
jgi:hypothetical protein